MSTTKKTRMKMSVKNRLLLWLLKLESWKRTKQLLHIIHHHISDKELFLMVIMTNITISITAAAIIIMMIPPKVQMVEDFGMWLPTMMILQMIHLLPGNHLSIYHRNSHQVIIIIISMTVLDQLSPLMYQRFYYLLLFPCYHPLKYRVSVLQLGWARIQEECNAVLVVLPSLRSARKKRKKRVLYVHRMMMFLMMINIVSTFKKCQFAYQE